MSSQTVEVMSVNVAGKEDRGPITINAEDFNPEVHTPIEGKAGRPRKQLYSDAMQIGTNQGTMDAAAVKELGEHKTKEQKDMLDNAKVVKDPKPLPGGAAVQVGPGAPREGTPHKPSRKKDEKMRDDLGGGSVGASPVGEQPGPEDEGGRKRLNDE